MIKWLKSLFASKFDPGPNNEDCTINVTIESGFSKEDFEALIQKAVKERLPTPTKLVTPTYVCIWNVPLREKHLDLIYNHNFHPLYVLPGNIVYYEEKK